MSDRVHFERRGHIAIITLDRPETRNAMDQATAKEMWDAWHEFNNDPDLWVEITTSAGDISFCAGADLKAQASGAPGVPGQAPYWAVLTERWNCWKPQIAAVNGFALGGGLELALVHDIIVAADHATFGLPEVRWSGTSGTGAVRLPKQIPLKPAMEMILTGKPISAERAMQLGIVNHVVPQAELLNKAIALAESICENAPIAVQASKRVAMYAMDTPLNVALSLSPGLSYFIDKSADRKEGPQSFVEKRPPRYTGR